jgi:predicted nuclease of predicted toxin-antitoxin system
MKILADVHIPYQLVKFLNKTNIEAVHVNRILDKWYTKDSDICRYADENDYVVVTKDIDFKNSHFLKNTPKKLIKINLGNINNQALIEIFEKYLDVLQEAFETDTCYVEIHKDNLVITK